MPFAVLPLVSLCYTVGAADVFAGSLNQLGQDGLFGAEAGDVENDLFDTGSNPQNIWDGKTQSREVPSQNGKSILSAASLMLIPLRFPAGNRDLLAALEKEWNQNLKPRLQACQEAQTLNVSDQKFFQSCKENRIRAFLLLRDQAQVADAVVDDLLLIAKKSHSDVLAMQSLSLRCLLLLMQQEADEFKKVITQIGEKASEIKKQGETAVQLHVAEDAVADKVLDAVSTRAWPHIFMPTLAALLPDDPALYSTDDKLVLQSLSVTVLQGESTAPWIKALSLDEEELRERASMTERERELRDIMDRAFAEAMAKVHGHKTVHYGAGNFWRAFDRGVKREAALPPDLPYLLSMRNLVIGDYHGALMKLVSTSSKGEKFIGMEVAPRRICHALKAIVAGMQALRSDNPFFLEDLALAQEWLAKWERRQGQGAQGRQGSENALVLTNPVELLWRQE